MAAPQKATPRWHGADAEQTKPDTPILPEAERKRFATLQAQAALPLVRSSHDAGR
jgi:hypothetical protein